jgi:hypothetical protein
MTTTHRIENVLAILVLGGGLVACTTQAASSDGGGGHAGSGTGGGSGGATGGTTGAGGSGTTVACGTGSLPPLNGVLCPAPAATITNFTYSADSGSTAEVRFGDDATMLSGGESTYANAGGTISSDVTQGDWHIVAHVANFSGFNIYFDNIPVGGMPCNMFDASAFSGISFKIWGTTGGAMITMGMGTLDDTVAPSWLNSIDAGSTMPSPGSCIPTSGNGPFYHPGCGDPTNVFAVTGTQAAPQTISLKWTDFTGGQCEPNVKPTQILSIYWQFPWSTTATPYDVDIHLDDIVFTP